MTAAELDFAQPPPGLRDELDRIASDVVGEDVANQVPLISALRTRYPHSIELEAQAIPGEPATFRFTCFQYALDLTEPPPVIVHIATVWRDVYPNATFVLYLIDRLLAEVARDDVTDGDVVVYFSNEEPAHAGKVRGGRVVSKWGTAHLWRHGLYEVPTRYGSEVRFFHPLTRSQSEEAFLRFAEQETGRTFVTTGPERG